MKLKKSIVENVQSLLHATSNVEPQLPLHTTLAATTIPETGQSKGLSGPSKPEWQEQQSECQTHDLQQSLQPAGNIYQLFEQVPAKVPRYIRDIENLTEAQLKKKYPREFNSWRSRKLAAAKQGISWCEDWNLFSAFLRYHGPMPDPTFTLDKIIAELGYVPENTRWASKKQQAWNKPNTIMVSDGSDSIPLGVWADRREISRDTCYRKFKAGWSLLEILAGVREQAAHTQSKPESKPLPLRHPWPASHADRWERKYKEYNPSYVPANGYANRLWFLLRTSLTQLRRYEALAAEVMDCRGEFHGLDNEFSPALTTEELAELARINSAYQAFRQSWEWGCQQYRDHYGEPINATDQRLRGC